MHLGPRFNISAKEQLLHQGSNPSVMHQMVFLDDVVKSRFQHKPQLSGPEPEKGEHNSLQNDSEVTLSEAQCRNYKLIVCSAKKCVLHFTADSCVQFLKSGNLGTETVPVFGFFWISDKKINKIRVKAQLWELNITVAKEIEVGSGRKAIIIFVPVPQLKSFQKIQVRLVRELENKFCSKHLVFIAQRRILPKSTRKSRNKNKQKCPGSCTLTAMHDVILEDLVFPNEIVGKRICVKLDGTRLIKVHLDKAQQNNIEHKVDTFSTVDKKLTGNDVVHEFPEFQL
uniref:small ribosomal subunit protein eS7-like n=1 Tax=Pristiophorus japonicus TaxID=55135 RepID=UPI00398E8FFA